MLKPTVPRLMIHKRKAPPIGGLATRMGLPPARPVYCVLKDAAYHRTRESKVPFRKCPELYVEMTFSTQGRIVGLLTKMQTKPSIKSSHAVRPEYFLYGFYRSWRFDECYTLACSNCVF